MLRFDRATTNKATKTNEGFLKATANVSKVGILKYRMVDGSIRSEFVPPETLFDSESMKSLELKPITIEHDGGKIDVKNAKKHQIGFTGETISREDNYLTASLIVTNEDGINEIEKKGRSEISLCYDALVTEQPGTYNGEPYTHVQTKRVYNHATFTKKGRAGSDVALRFDSLSSEDGFEIHEDNELNFPPKEKKIMAKVMIKGIEYEAAQEVINALNEATTKCDSLVAEVANVNKTVSEAQGKADAITAKFDSLTSELPAKIKAGVEERIALINVAQKALPKDTKFDSMDNDQIRKAVISAKLPKINLEGKGAEYISACFDSAVETIKETKIDSASFNRSQSATFMNPDAIVVDVSAEDARKKMIERNNNFGKDIKK